MQCISRLYVSHFGTATAWYDHMLFDLTDPDTDLPTDTFFNLENAGGKTSLLSYIFSCFDPKLDRWVQHLQKKAHRFVDYFARDGRPSFMIMEWLMPARAAGQEDYKLIIGQAVTARETGERGADTERWFFAFEAVPGLQLEDIPSAGLGMFPVRNMHEFVQWMTKEAKIKAGGDFFHTNVQEHWVTHLESARLIDVELLRMQVDFNTQEGGMEEGFLTFKSEHDLLRRLLWLTVDGEKAAAVRGTVAKTADKLQNKPQYEKRLVQLGRIQSAMAPFSEAAAHFELGAKAQASTQSQAAQLAAGLLISSSTHQQRATDKYREADVWMDSVQNAQTQKDACVHEDITLTGLVHQRSFNQAKQQTERSATALAEGKLHLRHIGAAKVKSQVFAAERRSEQLEASVQDAREGLKPVRQQAEHSGSLLYHALTLAMQGAQQHQLEAKNQESIAEGAIKTLQGQATAAQKQVRDLSSEQGQLEGFHANFINHRQRLRDDQLLRGDELAAAALLRVDGEVELKEAAYASLQIEQASLADQERSLRNDAASAAVAAGKAASTLDPMRKSLALGEGLKDTLSQHPVLRLVSDADTCDPDALTLTDDLRRFLSNTDGEIADRDVHLAQLRKDRTSILDTGLSGRSVDVEAVVRQLKELGVRSARAANTYVAGLCEDVEQARALVLSDPARFLGVNVADAEWPKVQQLSSGLSVKLAAPVTVAVASLKPVDVASDRLVVAPYDDSAYNKASAQQALVEFDQRISVLSDERDAYVQRRESAQDAREKLTRYLTEFGADRLRNLESEIAELEGVEHSERERGELLTEQADQVQQSGRVLAEQLTLLPTQIEQLRGALKRITEYQDLWEVPSAANQARLTQVLTLLDEQQALLEALGVELISAEEQRRRAQEHRISLSHDESALAQEQLSISVRNEAFASADTEQPSPVELQVLRSGYADAVATLQTQEKDRLGLLAEKLETARKECQKERQVFRENYADIDERALEPLLSVDFAQAQKQQEYAVQELDNANVQAREVLAVATSELKSFGQKHPQLTAPSDKMSALTDDQVISRIEAGQKLIQQLNLEIQASTQEAETSKTQAGQSLTLAKGMITVRENLKAAVPCDGIDFTPIDITEDVEVMVRDVMTRYREQSEALRKLRDAASGAYHALIKIAQSTAATEAEPELAAQIVDNDFELTCGDRQRLSELVEDRVKAVEDTLIGMAPDFDNCAGELYNLTLEGMSLINRASNTLMPNTTPYVGGKPILKLKYSPTTLAVDARKDAIRKYLNSLIDTKFIPEKGTDMVAACLLAFTGRGELGLQVLKMEQNVAYQYQPVNELKGSGGQGSVIAMFLYLLVSQLRADTQARAKRGGGGPLILDNPFAKVQTRALIDAQRLLAREIGVQLVFLTANADYNILAGFRRVNRLRKSGVNPSTQRSHIQMVSATFNDLPPAEAF
jgi:hypothetical protein